MFVVEPNYADNGALIAFIVRDTATGRIHEIVETYGTDWKAHGPALARLQNYANALADKLKTPTRSNEHDAI